MSPERLIARIQTRQFFFEVTEQSAQQLSLKMYQTSYTLVRQDGKWANSQANHFEMSPELVDAVIAAAGV